MSRPTIIAGNWKMHKTIGEAVQFVEALCPKIAGTKKKVLIAPPYTAISACALAAQGTELKIGAQNMCDSDEGAYTGEISVRMLEDAGAQFVILGHSERRTHFGETDEEIHHKLRRALEEGMPAILCIGESEKERDGGNSKTVLKKQLDRCLSDLTSEELQGLTIAYEPVWAIGTGNSASPEMAQETHEAIRSYLSHKISPKFATNLPLLYGGSVNPENSTTLLNQPDIDGALIGGSSLDIEAFTQMVIQ